MTNENHMKVASQWPSIKFSRNATTPFLWVLCVAALDLQQLSWHWSCHRDRMSPEA